MKIAYFDCFSGVSGDMILGSLIDAGLDPGRLKDALAGLPLSGYEIRTEKAMKNGISGTRFSVITDVSAQPRRGPADILEIIDRSPLKGPVKQSAADIFRSIARVEAEIHNVPVGEIHFHEIGAVDSIVDVIGACVAFDLLGVGSVYCSRINVGEGFVETAHGLLPVPAPATARLLEGIPVYSSGARAELATPTGAAIIAHFAKSYGPLPDMKLTSTGYGAGMKDLSIPNLLRVFIGEKETGAGTGPLVSIETNIDDMNPEFYQHLIERLLESGALDAYLTPVIMKKTRPGTLLTVLAREELREPLAAIIFSETSTAGIRYSRMERTVLDREMRSVDTRYGAVAVKILSKEGVTLTVSPEYEECKKTAQSQGVPLKQVYDEAKKIADSIYKK